MPTTTTTAAVNTITPENALTTITSVPTGGVPAAWWATNHPDRIAEYEAFDAAHRDLLSRLRALAKLAGADPTKFPSRNHIVRGLYPLDPAAPPAAGWRLTPEKYLVPSRKTAADRKSYAATEFAALAEIPAPRDFVHQMAADLWLDDRAYSTMFRLNGGVLCAFQGGDPDRLGAAGFLDFEVGETWQRMPLSAFHILREQAAEQG